MSSRPLLLTTALLGLVLGISGAVRPAIAAGSEQDRIAAQALFEQAKEMIAAGRDVEACAKFDESQRLDPGIGTQFNLADCYERIGRFASAYTLYVDVAGRSKAAGQAQREAFARERAEALKAKLSKLVIVIPQAAKVEGLRVTRDGAAVGSAQWGLPIPVDPGVHKVRVEAPGKQPWEGTIEVPSDAQQHSIAVPTLIDAPKQEQAAPGETTSPTDAQASAWPLQKTLGLVAGGVGVVGLGVGGFFGLRAINKNGDAKPYCDNAGNCVEPGYGYKEDARSAGNIATVGVAVGIAGLLGGAVLFFTAPSDERAAAALRIVPSVAKGGADLSISGSF